jgi:hypothetical protein
MIPPAENANGKAVVAASIGGMLLNIEVTIIPTNSDAKAKIAVPRFAQELPLDSEEILVESAGLLNLA